MFNAGWQWQQMHYALTNSVISINLKHNDLHCLCIQINL